MRTTYGAARAKAKRRLFKRAKGNRGGRKNLLRTVKETEVRSGAYSYRDRKVHPRLPTSLDHSFECCLSSS